MQDAWTEALIRLGGPSATGAGAVAEVVRRGLPHAAVDRLERDGFSAAELDRLVLPARTYRHRRQRDEALTPAESERALRVAMIAALAEETFGTADKAHRWLRRPLARFDGRSPLDMLDTEVGGRAVEDLLHAIGHGLLA